MADDPDTQPAPTPEISKLKWRCRRGMRELDVLLLRFVEHGYQRASPELQAAFVSLLSMPDPEILALITRRKVAEDQSLRNVIERLLQTD